MPLFTGDLESMAALSVPSPQPVVVTEQGPPGPSGISDVSVLTSITLSAFTVVRGGATVSPCDAGTAGNSESVVGLAITGGVAGSTIIVRHFGLLTDQTFNFSLGPVFCGAGGLLTQVFPSRPSSAFLLRVGTATGPNTLLIDIQPAVSLA